MTTTLAAFVMLGLAVAPNAALAQVNPVRAEAEYYADAYADHYQIPRELIRAVIAQESDWRPSATSVKGAKGLMQLMPQTAADYAVRDRSDIAQNIRGGVAYLADLSKQFNGDLRLVLAAYYCGPKCISSRGLKYTNADVYRYVASVRRRYVEEIARTQARQAQPLLVAREADVPEGMQ